jgi:hypothetical protein
MCIFNDYEWTYHIGIQGLLLALNGLNITVTLGVYFEYIKVLCTKYLLTIL